MNFSVKLVPKGILSVLIDHPTEFRDTVLDGAEDGVRTCLENHLNERNMNRPDRNDKSGATFPHTNYYSDAAGSISTERTGDAVIISATAPGLAVHLLGGEIKAKKKFLAIPADASVFDIWPREYKGRSEEKAFFVKRKKDGLTFLATKKDDGTVRALWWLKQSVAIKADPTVLPDQETILAEATSAAEDAIHALEK